MTVTSDEVRQALAEPVNAIIEAVRVALEQTPPELVRHRRQGHRARWRRCFLRGLDMLMREELASQC